MRFLLLLLSLGTFLGTGLAAADRIEQIIAGTKAFWGIRVVNLRNGAVFYQKNADHFFVPASNTKLFSTALALMRLGPDHRFLTTVVADSSGDVRLIGGGDPSLSARAYPYEKGPATGDPLAAIEALADQLVANGVRRIAGNIVGDDTAYVWEPYPAGWAENDTVWEYGAPVSALTINDNAFSLTVRPGERPGDLARLFLKPAFEYYTIDNRVRTEAKVPRKLRIDRLPGSRQLLLSGVLGIADRGETNILAIDDPALYAANVLADALTRRGISIGGHPVARHRLNKDDDASSGGVELARRTSPKLAQLAQVVDKVSQNLHAELLLREVGRVVRGSGSREAALEELKAFVKEIGLPPKTYQFEDASGLSRLTLVSPTGLTQLLEYMYRAEHRDAWMGLLPVGGEDGTLSTRFDGNPAAKRILAKTGTVSHVSALAGYVESKTEGWRAFSIVANNYTAPASEIRRRIDRIALLLAE